MKVLVSAGTFHFLKGGRKYSETAYALLKGGCKASCTFCSQPVVYSTDKTLLSRVKWYEVDLEEVAGKLSEFKRFCLQTVVKDGFEEESVRVLSAVKTPGKSVTTVPVGLETLKRFKEVGVDYLGSGVDTVPSMFGRVRKPFSFEEYFNFLLRAREVFGEWRVVAHLIYGLGESDREFAEVMEAFIRERVNVALFAFTPVKGTPMESRSPPSLRKYRLIQRLRLALLHGKRVNEVAVFDGDELVDVKFDLPGSQFTSGCPHCDRPYYNEHPLGYQYNLPYTVRA